jgi:hypothetical protein
MRKARKSGFILGVLAAGGLTLTACGNAGSNARADDPIPVSTYVRCHATSNTTAIAYVDLANITGVKQTVNAQIIVDRKVMQDVKAVPPSGDKKGQTSGEEPSAEYAGDVRNGHYYYHVAVPKDGITIEVKSDKDYARSGPRKLDPATCRD